MIKIFKLILPKNKKHGQKLTNFNYDYFSGVTPSSAQGLLLAGLGRLYVVSWMESGLATHKAGALPAVLPLWPLVLSLGLLGLTKSPLWRTEVTALGEVLRTLSWCTFQNWKPWI